jgi:hypothetical protein
MIDSTVYESIGLLSVIDSIGSPTTVLSFSHYLRSFDHHMSLMILIITWTVIIVLNIIIVLKAITTLRIIIVLKAITTLRIIIVLKVITTLSTIID